MSENTKGLLGHKEKTMKKLYYYTLEDMEGRIRMACATKKLAREYAEEYANDGICYKRMVKNNNFKKFAFMW